MPRLYRAAGSEVKPNSKPEEIPRTAAAAPGNWIAMVVAVPANAGGEEATGENRGGCRKEA
jgi:hypothetical protein